MRRLVHYCAFVKNVKSHNSYFSCGKCTQEEDYVENRMTFRVIAPSNRPGVWTPDRWGSSRPTPLLSLGFGSISGFTLDYMHLICLAVTHKLLMYWLTGPICLVVHYSKFVFLLMLLPALIQIALIGKPSCCHMWHCVWQLRKHPSIHVHHRSA